MKKYLILEQIGDALACLGLLSTFFFMCIDFDSLEMGQAVKAASIIVASVIVMLIGQLLAHIRSVEGRALSLLVVAGAWLYERFQRPRKLLKDCHEIKAQFGTYRHTYKKCKAGYESYIKSLHEWEDETHESIE